MIKSLLTACAALFLSVASAQAQESFVLHSKGAWTTSFVAGDYMNSCEAVTDDYRGQMVDITIWEDGTSYLYFWLDTDNQAAYRDIKFIVHIDYTEWTFRNAHLDGKLLTFELTNQRELKEFINDLYRSNAIALLAPNGNRVGTWSLNGSAAALRALVDCARKL